MKNFLLKAQWGWKASGVALAISFLIAVVFVKPIGVSTQFVILDGIIWNIFSDELVTEDTAASSGYASTNAYLNKSGGKYAKNVANPMNYSFIFVLAMLVGGFLASRLQATPTDKKELTAPEVWRTRFGDSPIKRYLVSFIGGVLVLLGSRLAGGCTSGHGISGTMQLAVSSWVAAMCFFAGGIATAFLLY